MLLHFVEKAEEFASVNSLLPCIAYGSCFKCKSGMMHEVPYRLYLCEKYCENLYGLELKGQPETHHPVISWKCWSGCNRKTGFEAGLHCLHCCFPGSWVSCKAIYGVLNNAAGFWNMLRQHLFWSNSQKWLQDCHWHSSASNHYVTNSLYPSSLCSLIRRQEDVPRNRLSEEELLYESSASQCDSC